MGGLATYLLNFSLVESFQGSSPLSAWDAILSVAGAAAHLRGTEGRWLWSLRVGSGVVKKIAASAGSDVLNSAERPAAAIR